MTKITSALSEYEIIALENSRLFLNRSIEALNLQRSRIDSYDFGESEDAYWNYLADVHFYIVALKRIKQTVLTSKKVNRVYNEIRSELASFDHITNDAIQMRHILEHIDEYVWDKGRNKTIMAQTLPSSWHDRNGCFFWAGLTFDIVKLHEEASNLALKYRAILDRENELFRRSKAN